MNRFHKGGSFKKGRVIYFCPSIIFFRLNQVKWFFWFILKGLDRRRSHLCLNYMGYTGKNFRKTLRDLVKSMSINQSNLLKSVLPLLSDLLQPGETVLQELWTGKNESRIDQTFRNCLSAVIKRCKIYRNLNFIQKINR